MDKKTQTPLQDTTIEKIEELKRAFVYFYDENLADVYKAQDYTDPITHNHYKNSAELIDELWELGVPKNTPLKKIELLLEQRYETLTKAPEYKESTMTGAPEYAVDANTLTPDQLKELEEKDKLRREVLEKTRTDSKEAVEEAIAKKKEIAEQTTEESNKKDIKEVGETDKKVETELKTEQVTDKPPTATVFHIPEDTIQERIDKLDKKINEATEIKDGLKGKKLYTRIEVPQKFPFSKEEQEYFERLKINAQANPQKFTEDLSKTITEKLIKTPIIEVGGNENIKVTDVHQIETISKITAANVTSVLIDEPTYSPLIQIPTINYLVKNAEVEVKAEVKKTPFGTREFKDFASMLSDSKMTSYEMSRQIMRHALGQKLQENILPDINEVKVEFLESPQEGFDKTIDLSELPQQQIESLESQRDFVRELRDLTEPEIKQRVLTSANSLIETQIARLPANNLISQTYNNKVVQASLIYLGYKGPVEYVATTTFGRIAVSTGYGPTAAWVQTVTGANLGVGAVVGGVAASTAATATTIAATGGVMASEAFLGGAGAAAAGAATGTGIGATISSAFAALGSWAGPVGIAIGAALGAVVGKIIAWAGPKLKNFIQKNKDWLLVGGLAGMYFFGGFGRILFAIPTLMGAAGVAASGFYVASAARSLGNFARALFFISMGDILKPILIFILVTPLVIMFILFIINSGAYIVPPNPLDSSGGPIESPYIEVTKNANPPGPFQNTELKPLIVTYTIRIHAKKGTLTNIVYSSLCSTIKANNKPPCPGVENILSGPEGSLTLQSSFPPPAPTEISPVVDYIISYQQKYTSPQFIDTFVTDTFTVKADTTEIKGAEAAASASIKIGKPPEECPTGWPTNHGYITQGAKTSSCGSNCSHGTIEAIDIGVSGVQVKSTHSGTVVTSQRSSCYGNYIQIKSTCNGKEFTTNYYHLEGSSVRVGQIVTMGQAIGLSGNTGSCTTGPHLHYEFKFWPSGNPNWPNSPPFMMTPYIPENIKRGCRNATECGVSF